MSRTATAVIGAGYGDEAKGAWVDRFSTPDTTVVRHNGGAQAGHTVTLDDGRRHVFHHVGAGAFQGAGTFLSRHFLSNPMVLLEELRDLRGLGVEPVIVADPRGLVTTPYDMFVNRIVEISRGGRRHGSCGLGIGETVERSERGMPLTVADLRDGRATAALLRRIRDEWVPARLTELGVTTVPEEYADLLGGDSMVAAAMFAAEEYLSRVDVDDGSVLARAAHVVFEGAQGLMLDQHRGAFPYVTRSNTGIANVLDVAREAGIGEVEAVYATRAYVTRHGAGPLSGELPGRPWAGVVDMTNEPNAWQETIRYAHLDVDVLARAVADDLQDARYTGVVVRPSLAVSCLDQVPDRVPVLAEGRATTVDRGVLPRWLGAMLDADRTYAAVGAERSGWCAGRRAEAA